MSALKIDPVWDGDALDLAATLRRFQERLASYAVAVHDSGYAVRCNVPGATCLAQEKILDRAYRAQTRPTTEGPER